MKTKPYKVIFAALALSVVFVLALQGFWARNFYLQKQEEFSKAVYASLEKVNYKLRERETMSMLKQELAIAPSISFSAPRNVQSMQVTKSVQVQVRNRSMTTPDIMAVDMEELKRSMSPVLKADSSFKISISGDTSVRVKALTRKDSFSEREVKTLVNKMVTEIRINDNDERNPDTLKQIIRRVFENKGLFLPFEFALKKVFKDQDETLARSKGFDDTKDSYISDLSSENVFSTHNFLFIQFPEKSSYLLSSVRNMLLLSLVFSLIIIGSFYYTIRLILSQKKLSEIRNDFVNNVTHELKTPIATNSLAIDALANPIIKNDDEKFKEYLRILKEENKKLNVHVERVLQMALLDKGELPLNKQLLDIKALIAEVVSSFGLLIREQKAVVHFDSSGAAIVVNGDQQHLQTVFSNLLDNALKYCPENCVVHIALQKDNGYVTITFSDNGSGIGKEHREKIFDKFYRVQSGNLHDIKGFGLGLSYVKSIVEAHGGNIVLKSELGKGSEFIIQLKTHE